jgi:hypothetical protein
MDDIKTFDDMMKAVLAIFPNAQLEQDNYGQVIVYTDLSLDSNDNVVPYEEDEDSDDVFDPLQHLQQHVMKKND